MFVGSDSFVAWRPSFAEIGICYFFLLVSSIWMDGWGLSWHNIMLMECVRVSYGIWISLHCSCVTYFVVP